jgi:hypothetical protein
MKINKVIIRFIILAAFSLAITACTNPSMPKQPSKLNRIPVNKTMPIELES